MGTEITSQRTFQLLTPAAAAKLLAITPNQFHNLAIHGDINYVNIGIGRKRETRRYRLQDIEGFLQSRALTGIVKWSTRPPLEITDEDLLKAAKVVARDRRRRERDLEQKALEEKWRKRREEREAWLKKCEEEAVAIRERVILESINSKGKVPAHKLRDRK